MKIFFIATRISGNDGVSLESIRWREVLTRMGYRVDFIAGKLDRRGILLPNLYFQSPEVVKIYNKIVYGKGSYRKVEKEIFTQAGIIEGELRELFNSNGKIDLLITPNVLSLPMHFSLSVALTRVIEEAKTPTIARHHDFWWERERFLNSTMFPFFERFFPPKLPNIKHVVINSIAKEELKKRRGISSTIISDCFDFDSDRNKLDSFSRSFREDFKIGEDDLIFLQPTRIVPRKRIELSIELVKGLADKRIVLVIAGEAGDEGDEYEKTLRLLAKKSKISYLFIGKRVNSRRRIVDGKKIFTLWDCFVNSDFVTYPTKVEGFGNQFVEAVYFKKPVILTPYEVYKKDIKPLGFEVVEMPDKVTKKVIEKVRELMANNKARNEMVEKNFKLGKKNFSYTRVEKKLRNLFREMGLS